MTKHNIEPVYNQDSRILILGSFPSVKSREAKFFYHHPQNRFWKVLAALFQEEVPQTIEEKKTFLLRNHLALWDVIESCEIKGSSDASITNVKVNDLDLIVKNCPVEKIITNGKAANRYYHQYFDYNLPVIQLPSTSPANAMEGDFMERDLTQGKIGKSILLFSISMILGNLLQQFYNIVDTYYGIKIEKWFK